VSARELLTGAVPDASSATDESDSLSILLADRSISSAQAPSGAVIGRLIGMKAGAGPLVLLSHDAVALPARSTVDLRRSHIGQQVLLAFEDNDRLRPIVIGVMRDAQAWSTLPDTSGRVEVDVDGKRMVVSARHELVLRCGDASITLDHDGRITIRGTQVISHSEGVNRIRGGSVQLN